MPKKTRKSVIIIDSEKKKELMEIPDNHTFFKLIVDLDSERVEIVTIPFSVIKEKIKEKVKTKHGK